jgi:hypothetical protein
MCEPKLILPQNFWNSRFKISSKCKECFCHETCLRTDRRTDMQTRPSNYAFIYALHINNLSGQTPWSRHPLLGDWISCVGGPSAGLRSYLKRAVTPSIYLHEFLILMLAYSYVTRTTMYLQGWGVRYALNRIWSGPHATFSELVRRFFRN